MKKFFSGIVACFMLCALAAPVLADYTQPQRPQFHFTPEEYALNDPNGLVYNEHTGEYHMFFQHDRPQPENPHNVQGNQKSWGHAVSYDLVNWEERPLAIVPDENGTIWSGSCVIDENNTSGFFDDSTPPKARMVAFFTYYGGTKPGNGMCSVGVAYSKDNGATWVKPFTEPVIPNENGQYQAMLRDPKVVWYPDDSYEAGGIWVMVMSDAFALIFTSTDLVNWESNGQMRDINRRPMGSECPDLYPIALDGNPDNIKWVYHGGGVFYIVGRLEKNNKGVFSFVAETEKIETVNPISELAPGLSSLTAPEMYAAQTFYNDPKGRRIEICWMRDQVTQSNKPWTGTLSIALEVKLETVNGEMRLVKYPVQELNSLREEAPLLSAENKTVEPGGENLLNGLSETQFDIEATVSVGSATEFGFYLRKNGASFVKVAYNVEEGRFITDKNAIGGPVKGVYSTAVSPKDGKITFRILGDASVIDAFANQGQAYHSGLTFPSPQNSGMEFYALGGAVTVESIRVYRVKPMNRQAVSLGLRPTEAPAATQSPAPGPQNTQNILWWALGGAAVLAAAVLGLVFVKKGKGKAGK